MARGRVRTLGVLGGSAVCLLLAACEGNLGDPGPIPLASGESCASIQKEMNALLAKGVRGKVERAQRGASISPAARADVDRYNALLNQYLGARCHAG